MGIPFGTYCRVEVTFDSWRGIEFCERGKVAWDDELLEWDGSAVLSCEVIPNT